MNYTKLRIQAGLEVTNGPVRKVRMTPLDVTESVPQTVADLLLLVSQVADLSDLQPGDGEVDLRIGELNALAKNVNAPQVVRTVANHADKMGLAGTSSVFFRIRRVE